MPIDLFENEQEIYDNSVIRAVQIRKGATLNFEEYAMLVKEYGKLLKQLRRATRMSDKTTTDLYRANLNLTDKVNFDALTGIYNRRYMEESMQRIIKSMARATNGLLSVLMLDVDHFKLYNDTYGHNMGDICLRSVAEVLTTSVLRPDDFVARYGGEEFVIVLPNTGAEGAQRVADRVLERIKACNIEHETNDSKYVTISIGATTAIVEYTHNCEDYMKRADAALYLSKQGGRNRYTYLDFKGEQS
ncbi:MAG: GGDEF domain-containing protein [Fibromonadales bacterium]|nr:GGDEF domain-containing protein [Fibromonadales bacterium]